MSSVNLIDRATTTTTLDLSQAKTFLNNSGVITISAHGTGTSFSATVAVYPVYGTSDVYVDTPQVLTVTNAAPTATYTATSPHARFVAVVTAFTGSGSVSASVEG